MTLVSVAHTIPKGRRNMGYFPEEHLLPLLSIFNCQSSSAKRLHMNYPMCVGITPTLILHEALCSQAQPQWVHECNVLFSPEDTVSQPDFQIVLIEPLAALLPFTRFPEACEEGIWYSWLNQGPTLSSYLVSVLRPHKILRAMWGGLCDTTGSFRDEQSTVIQSLHSDLPWHKNNFVWWRLGASLKRYLSIYVDFY